METRRYSRTPVPTQNAIILLRQTPSEIRYATISQCPPLCPPTRRILPSAFNCARFFSTPLTESPTSTASPSRVMSGYFFRSSKIFPTLFPTLFFTANNASRKAVSINSMNIRASPVILFFCGRASRGRGRGRRGLPTRPRRPRGAVPSSRSADAGSSECWRH